MKTIVSASLFVASCLFAATAVASDVLVPPVTVTFEYQRAHGDTRVWDAETALNALNHRLVEDLGNGNGWGGVGKAKLKLPACTAPEVFKGILLSGFSWKRIAGTTSPEKYTGTITRIRCL